MRTLILVFATGFGAGYSPVASGTAGSALALAAYWFLVPEKGLLLSALALLFTVLSVFTSGKAEIYFNSNDDSRIVIDEIAGMFVALLFLPKTLFFAAAAFILFRFFDVIKPLYIRKTQDWPGGWGVTFDDIFAALLSNIILQAVRYVFKI